MSGQVQGLCFIDPNGNIHVSSHFSSCNSLGMIPFHSMYLQIDSLASHCLFCCTQSACCVRSVCCVRCVRSLRVRFTDSSGHILISHWFSTYLPSNATLIFFSFSHLFVIFFLELYPFFCFVFVHLGDRWCGCADRPKLPNTGKSYYLHCTQNSRK